MYLYLSMTQHELVEAEPWPEDDREQFIPEIRDRMMRILRESRQELDYPSVIRPFLSREGVLDRERLCCCGSGNLLPVTDDEAAELVAAQRHRDCLREAELEGTRLGSAFREAEREAARSEFELEVLDYDRGTPGECGRDERAHVRVTDTKTSESCELIVRNAFDVGMIINRLAGGIPSARNGRSVWLGWEAGRGWFEDGEMTAIEVRAVRYVREFGPVSSWVRM